MSTINKDENLLSEFFDRSIKSNDDEFSVCMVCTIIKDNPSLITKATNLIADKITSDNLEHSLRSLQILEICMSKCGPEFQNEVSKYRFLNKLIALVSPNHSAKYTAKEVRDKIVDCLSLWTVQYPEKDKIRSAFDMLCKQGIDTSVSHNNLPKDSNNHHKKVQTLMNEANELKLKQLLQSSNPEDLRRANLFIQFHVNQDARKFERKFKQKSELTEIENTANVLIDVLNSYENIDDSDTRKNDESRKNDSLILLNDLYEMCEKNKSIIEKMPNIMEVSEEAELIDEIFRVNNTLISAMEKYDNLFKAVMTSSSLQSENTLDTEKIKNLRLDEILSSSFNEGSLFETNNFSGGGNTNSGKKDDDGLTELNDIFKNIPAIESTECSNFAIKPILPLKITNKEKSEAEQMPAECERTPESNKVDLLSTIDKISEELFQESLKPNNRTKSFVKEPEKITLNEMLTKNKQVPSKSSIEEDPLNSKFKTNSPSLDEIKQLIFEASPVKNNRTETFNGKPSKHLSEIYIDLKDVIPSNKEPRDLLSDPDGLNIKLNFTENKPGTDITVIVISTVNKNRANIKDFHFEASVPLPCKLYLLSSTGTSLQGRIPFRSPSDLQQILLLYNPTKQPVDITCILSYILGDDPDPIKQSIFAEGII